MPWMFSVLSNAMLATPVLLLAQSGTLADRYCKTDLRHWVGRGQREFLCLPL